MEFAMKKNVPINKDGLLAGYDLKDTAFSNKEFLDGIKKSLKAYAFNRGCRYDYVELVKRTILYREGEGAVVLDAENKLQLQQQEIANKDIKRLRNEYLHWNANYGEGSDAGDMIDIIKDSATKFLTQPNEPNFEGPTRTRHIRH